MRYNIFNKIHRPLKECLLSTCISLSADSKWNITLASAAINKVEEVLQICDEQVRNEGLQILPYVFEYEPSVWNSFTTEHHKIMNAARSLENLVRACYKASGSENKLGIMKLVSDSFTEFMLLNYNHMDDEEAVLNEILWRYYTDGTIRQMEDEINLLPAVLKQTARKSVQMASAA